MYHEELAPQKQKQLQSRYYWVEKNPIPYVSEIYVKRAHHLSKRINSLGPF